MEDLASGVRDRAWPARIAESKRCTFLHSRAKQRSRRVFSEMIPGQVVNVLIQLECCDADLLSLGVILSVAKIFPC
jgi:hypothetical protein